MPYVIEHTFTSKQGVGKHAGDVLQQPRFSTALFGSTLWRKEDILEYRILLSRQLVREALHAMAVYLRRGVRLPSQHSLTTREHKRETCTQAAGYHSRYSMQLDMRRQGGSGRTPRVAVLEWQMPGLNGLDGDTGGAPRPRCAFVSPMAT